MINADTFFEIIEFCTINRIYYLSDFIDFALDCPDWLLFLEKNEALLFHYFSDIRKKQVDKIHQIGV